MNHKVGSRQQFDYDQFVRDPIQYKEQAFEEVLSNCGDGSTSAAYPKLRDQFHSSIQAQDFQKTKCLNSTKDEDVKNGNVYRFRCMVQDCYEENEYFFSIYNSCSVTKKSGFLMEDLDDEQEVEIDMTALRNRLKPRRVLKCISVPGENEWLSNLLEERGSLANGDESQSQSVASIQPTGNVASIKEKYDNFPLTTMKGSAKSVIVKTQDFWKIKKVLVPHALVYDENWPLPLNSMVEFIGILYKEETPEAVENMIDLSLEETEADAGAELPTYSPALWIIPRLHAVSYRKVPPFPETFQYRKFGLELRTTSSSLIDLTRQYLMDVLLSVSKGDDLVARYILLNLISKVHLWNNHMAIGKLGVNIFGSSIDTNDVVNNLCYVVKSLVPRSVYLDFVKDGINTALVIPGRKTSEVTLKSAALQLPSQTHIVIHDNIPPKDLNPTGIRNQAAFQNLAATQRVKYDIPYFDGDFELDAPLIIVSAQPSKIKTDVVVPLIQVQDPSKIESHLQVLEALKNDKIGKESLPYCRDYLSGLKLRDVAILPDMEREMQLDFVNSRQVLGQQSMTEDDFSLLITMARYICLSYGSDTMEITHWQEARNMESERKARLTALK